MEGENPIPEAPEQGRDVGASGVCPVGIDLEDDRRIENLREGLQGVPAGDRRDQLEVVIVVADAEAACSGPAGDGT